MGGHFFLSSMPADPARHPLASDTPPPHDGAVNSTIIKSVLSSAAEAEAGAMFLNCQNTLPHTRNTVRNGPSTIRHPCSMRQQYNYWHREQHDQTTPIQSNGHALFLASRSRGPATFQILPGQRRRQPRCLLYQAPLSQPPPNNATCLFTYTVQRSSLHARVC
jgi:hypothetical protein